MSLATFPTLAGLGWSVDRQEMWQTRKQLNVSGKETRVADWSYPRHQWDLTFEFLRQGSRGGVTYAEMAQLEGFFNLRSGMADPFVYRDADDNSVTGQSIGTGDGTTASFPLMKLFGGALEPVAALTSAPTIYKTDWQGTNVVQSTTARTNRVSWSGAWATSPWNNFAFITTTQSGFAPDGVSPAFVLSNTTTVTNSFILQDDIPASSGPYTASFYFKLGANVPFLLFQLNSLDGNSGCNCGINLSTFAMTPALIGTATLISASVTAIDGGWYRAVMSLQMNNGGTKDRLLFALCNVNPNASTIAPATLGATLNVWGAQVETGTVATPYLPTAASAVTAADYVLTAGISGEKTVATFTVPPAPGATMTADIAYAYVCRFLEDNLSFSQFMSTLYEAKKVSLISVK